MKTRGHIGMLVGLSLAAGLVTKALTEASLSNATVLGEGLGHAFVLIGLSVLLPGIPAAIYWLFKRQPMRNLVPAMWVIWVLATVLITSGTIIEQRTDAAIPKEPRFSKHTYAPQGCDFSVVFPGKTVESTGILPGVGEYLRADYYGPSFLRAECIPLNAAQHKALNDKPYLLQQAKAYADSNGLRNVEYLFKKSLFGPKVSLRGFKTIDGTVVTYEVEMYLGPSSLLSLYAGGPSKTYPQPGVTTFFTSLQMRQ